jgi:predicted ribosome quality control (RQC) complex YloA/Tae2 family protein
LNFGRMKDKKRTTIFEIFITLFFWKNFNISLTDEKLT